MSKLISKDYFQKTLMKIIKAMKCDVYLITDNMIIGTNEEHSYLSVVSGLINGIPDMKDTYIEISKNSLLEIDKILSTNNNEDPANIIEPFNLIWGMARINGKYGISSIMDTYNRTILYINNIPDFYSSNIKENEDFNNILGLKSADGAVPFRFGDRDTIFIYPGLLGINKSDVVSMKYFRTANIIGYDICEFDIHKKFITIQKFIGYLPLR